MPANYYETTINGKCVYRSGLHRIAMEMAEGYAKDYTESNGVAPFRVVNGFEFPDGTLILVEERDYVDFEENTF